MIVDQTSLLDWQKRVIQEKEQLDERLKKLTAFIDSNTPKPLPLEECIDLLVQQEVMTEYSRILSRRISRFV